MYAGDTIAAVATPPGPGGIGIIRVSGPLSASIAVRVFAPSGVAANWESHHLYHGRVTAAAGHVLDEGLAVLMRGPRSYTGEDVLELHCHGSSVLLRRVLAEVLGCGARLAEPGEFTRRAFLNGRLDLTQAEAVLDLAPRPARHSPPSNSAADSPRISPGYARSSSASRHCSRYRSISPRRMSTSPPASCSVQ